MANITLDTVASVPAGTGITVTVYEDTNNDGTAEYSTSQAIADGTQSYTLTGFAGGAAKYRIEVDLTSTDRALAPWLDSATVTQASGKGFPFPPPMRGFIHMLVR